MAQKYNRFVTEENWKRVNKYNKELIDDYMLELKAQGKAEGTIYQYNNDLRILCVYVLEELDNKELYKLKKKHFRNLVLYFKEKGMSNARVNRIMSAVRTLLEFASNEEDYEDEFEINYASKVKGLHKEDVRDIVFLSWEQVKGLYDELITRRRYQEALLLALGIDSAGRKNELYQVKKDSITMNGNFTNEVIGKRGKKFRLMYNELTKEAYTYYMDWRGEDDVEELWVIKDSNGVRPASLPSVYAWVKSWREILNYKFDIDCELNVHSLRHIALELLSTGEHYICKNLNKKFELSELKLLAHHNDISTTDSYLKSKDEDLLLEAFGI